MADRIEEIAAGLVAAGFDSRIAGQIAAQSRYGYSLATSPADADRDIPIGATKFGGAPDLPEGTAWPWRPGYPADSQQVTIFEEMIKRQEPLAAGLDPQSETPEEWRITPERARETIAHFRRSAESARAPAALDFLAQFDLSVAAAAGTVDIDLPSTGLLSIFSDAGAQPWGMDKHDHLGTAVLYHPPDAGPLSRRTAKRATGYKSPGSFDPLTARPIRWLMPLPIDSVAFESLDLGADARNDYDDWLAAQPWPDVKPEHRLAGWPTPIQGEMESDCELVAEGGERPAYRSAEAQILRREAAEWILLAQIASDDRAGFLWGDNGYLYFWIRRRDLAERRFDRVRTMLQCF